MEQQGRNPGCKNCKYLYKIEHLYMILPSEYRCDSNTTIGQDSLSESFKIRDECHTKNVNNGCKEFSPSLWYKIKQFFRKGKN